MSEKKYKEDTLYRTHSHVAVDADLIYIKQKKGNVRNSV